MKDGTTYRILSDQVGSVRLVVNATTGAVAQRIDYDAFGNANYVAGSPNFQPFGFAGGLTDHDTGLVRFGARDYDPRVGRWTSKDPIRFEGGDTSLYGYVLSDPANRIDPIGLGDRIDFPVERTRPPGTGAPRGPATVHDLSNYSPRQPVMDPKAIVCRAARVAGTAAAAAAAGYSTYCAGSRAFCYLGQSAMSPCECLQTFDEDGVCCPIPGAGPECNPEPNSCPGGSDDGPRESDR